MKYNVFSRVIQVVRQVLASRCVEISLKYSPLPVDANCSSSPVFSDADKSFCRHQVMVSAKNLKFFEVIRAAESDKLILDSRT
ncbi:hypothetical protein L596_021167 [Steinernema carpocapsae]|uniref:Uncharacterized protein n=1 Tax=Steinernema carpocapsae TaxID=34508 RepID=A0A4U5MWM4_STECR|nr:hypothetical protein L596_021167 [Steinernema carpocapsae]